MAYVWKKSGSGLLENTIISNVTLTGSGSARAIEHIPETNAVFAITNDKVYRLSSSLGISGQLATGTANIIRSLVYDDSHNTLYYCTNDGYGTINTINLSPSAKYNDPQTNSVLGCAIDETNQYMYLAGSDLGASFTCEILKVALSTNTEVDCASSADTPFYNVCYSTYDDSAWVMASASSKVKKYDSNLNLLVDVTVGAVPRNCSISNSDGANRLYVNIESTDSVTIIDTEANVIISTHVVCNLGVTAPKMDTKRLFNTTNTYVACPEASNSVLIDNTVSEIPADDPDEDVSGIDCTLPANVNILTCRLNDIGNPLVGTSTLLNQSGTNIVCMLGLIPCTQDDDGNFTPDNPDIKTNGVGFLFLAIALGIFVSLLYLGSDGRLSEIPTFVWFIGSLAIVGAMTQLGFVDPTILIVAVIVVSALAAAKVKGIIGDSTLFRGE